MNGRQRDHPGLLIHRDTLAPDEIRLVNGLWATTPLRTALDLVCRFDLVEGVVAVDALANHHRFHPDLLLHLAARHRGMRGVDRIPSVPTDATRWSGSPMESLAWPELKIAIEYEGVGHPTPEVVLRDVGAHLTRARQRSSGT